MSTIWDTILDKNKEVNNQPEQKNNSKNILPISELTINEFAKRNLAIPLYSEILKEEIWFCSNESMVQKIKQDNPDAVCYTASELLELIRLNPSRESLKKIHLSKSTFNGTLINNEKI